MSIDVARLHDLEQRIEKTDDGEMISLPVGFVRELAAAALVHQKYEGRIQELIDGAELEMAKAEQDNQPEKMVALAGGEEWT